MTICFKKGQQFLFQQALEIIKLLNLINYMSVFFSAIIYNTTSYESLALITL